MRRRGAKTVLAVVLVGASLTWAQRFGWLYPLQVITDYTVRPIGRLFSGTGSSIGSFFSIVGDIRNLSADNARLRSDNARLRTQVVKDSELQVENDDLRRQLGVSASRHDKLLAAEVIAYQPDNFRQYITINRGSLDGVSVGMAIVSEGSLVGTVSEVAAKSAKVFLLIDPNFRVNGIISETRASGTVHGQIGAGLEMEKIAQSDTVRPGDTVITSGLGGDVPKGLIIGRVESVSTRDNAVFQTAQLASDLRFNKLELIYVILGEGT